MRDFPSSGMPTTEKLSNRTQTTAGTLVVTPTSSSTSGTQQSKRSPTSNKPEKNSNAISINSFETRLLNMTFSESLQDPDSHEFKDLKAMLETALTVVFQDMPGFLEAKVTGFRKGSVITMFSVVFNDTSSIASRSFTEVMVRLKNANGTKVLNDLLLGDVTSVISVRNPERRVSKKERDVDEGQSVPQWVLIMIAPVYFTLMVIFMGVVSWGVFLSVQMLWSVLLSRFPKVTLMFKVQGRSRFSPHLQSLGFNFRTILSRVGFVKCRLCCLNSVSWSRHVWESKLWVLPTPTFLFGFPVQYNCRFMIRISLVFLTFYWSPSVFFTHWIMQQGVR